MKILLVEDDPRLSRSLARLLEQDRHNVEVAADGETGLDIALGENGIDVVILDIGLPDMSGLEVARRIRRERKELAILMLTARDTVGDRVTGPRLRRRRLRREAVRLRRARRASPGPRPARRERRPAPGAAAHRRARSSSTRRPGRSPSMRPVDLSPREFSLLESLLRHPGQALSRDQLLDQAWPFGVAVTPERRRRLRPLPPDEARVAKATGSRPSAASGTG